MADLVSERAQHLLRLLIERYIRDGQPVSSKSLAEDENLSLSPATIRNVMADLEERGYLRSLHASSGRVPTAQGYRLFVNYLLSSQSLPQDIYSNFAYDLSPAQNTTDLVANASSLLSRLTRMAGLVTIPKVEIITLRHIEFLPLSNNRVLVILVLNEKEVQNRIIKTERSFSRPELEQAANYLNQTFSGFPVEKVRTELLAGLQNDRYAMDQLMRSTIEVAADALTQEQPTDDYILAGEHHLLGIAETNVERLRQLFDTFMKKREILYLLDQCIHAQGVQIFIGDEAGYEIFDGCSVVSSPYGAEGNPLGVLAVIGPTRMPYERVIPIVDISAKLLSSALARE
jgi:heat-inducible transcriptional repressor